MQSESEKKFYIKTYGCQMNELDSLQMGRLLKHQGYTGTGSPEEADVILINTCSVREKPHLKLYSDVGRYRSLKLKNPNLVLAVSGCQAQVEGANLQRRFPYLDLVLGPDNTAKLPHLVDQVLQRRKRLAPEIHFASAEDYQFLHLLPDEEENSVKAFVTIMKGCDNFCSFCIVPYVRGREVCRSSDDIVHEVRALAERGVREVTLLGQNVNSYGMGRHSLDASATKKPQVESFARLLHRLSVETDIRRIRFTTSHPKDLPEELLEQFQINPKLAQQFHLPLQSGSNLILEKMYRGYTREEFLEKIHCLRAISPQIGISSDIIVGFPGESDEDFEATLDLLREVRFDLIFSFVYSPRPKTTAALYWQDDIDADVKSQRLQRLQMLQNEITHQKNQVYLNQTLEVLVEGLSKQGDTYFGRSSQNHGIHFAASEGDVGNFLPIKITHAGPNSLRGEKI